MEYIHAELQKLDVLWQNGLVADRSYWDKARYLRGHGQIPDAEIGKAIADVFPFKVIDLRLDGPSHNTGVIKAGDQLVKVDRIQLTAQLTGAQVRSVVVGSEGSLIELMFKETPPRTDRGAYRVRLVRQAACKGGVTQVRSESPLPPPAGMPGGSVSGMTSTLRGPSKP